MDTAHKEELGKLLASFDAGVLVAQTLEGELRAHPVALGRVRDDGVLWLAGGIDGTPILDPERRDACMLVCQHGARHLLLSGSIELDFDPAAIHLQWLERWVTWFPDGPTSLSLVLARFAPRLGEYWDHTGLAPGRYLVEAARSLVRGAHLPVRREEHFRIV